MTVSSLRTRNRLVLSRISISSLFLLHGITFATWISRIPSAQVNLHLSAGLLGVVLLCAATGSLLSMPVTGMLVTRYGSRSVVWIASPCFCLALLLLAASTNVWQLAASLLVYGAAAGSMNVSMNSQGVLLEGLAQRPMLSSFHALFSLGGMIGAFLGGAAADRGMSMQRQFTISALLLTGGVLVASLRLLDSKDKTNPPTTGLTLHLARPILALGLLALCSGVGEGSMADWSGVYMHSELQASLGRSAAGYAVFSAAMVVGRFAGDWLTYLWGSQWCVRTGCLLGAAGLSIVLLLHSIPVTLAGFLVIGLGLSVVIPNVFRAAGRVQGIPPGYGLAAATTMGYLGILSGPPVIGGLAQLFSLRIALIFVVFAMAVGALLASRIQLSATEFSKRSQATNHPLTASATD